MDKPQKGKRQDNQVLLYQADSGEARLEVLFGDETVWLTQAQMAELFQTERSNITRHIQNIFEEGELEYQSSVQKIHRTKTGRPPEYYNLDVIIAVGYRVNSRRGTQFRIWATKTLSEYAKKGFVMDDDRLVRGGSRYFDDLVERVRRIRTSEFHFHKKVRAIFATSIDYDKKSQEARTFFATVQNKFHFAINERTAAELIMERVDRDKLHLGLTNWQGIVLTLQDAFVAKNYLEELELKRLELLVEQFLSFAELRFIERKPMYMREWIRKLDEFIGVLNEKPVLTNAGTQSRKGMEAKVRKEYEAYKERVMLEEALSEVDWELKLLDAFEHMALPAPDDLDSSGFTDESYNERLMQLSSRKPHDEEEVDDDYDWLEDFDDDLEDQDF